MSLLAGVGATLGFLLWSLMGQGAVSILFGSLGGTFTCKTDVEHALQQFVKLQLYSALAGAVVVPLLTWLIRRTFGKKRAAIERAGTTNA
jgi:membrane protein DedA with SNARE-associated domain